MSAAPQAPDPSEPGDPSSRPDAEGWALLEGLRRRLDEQANQNRKTQTQVRQLAESIARAGRRSSASGRAGSTSTRSSPT